MLKFVFGLIVLVMLVGLMVHVKEKKPVSEVIAWNISVLAVGVDIFGLIVPGANEAFINRPGRDMNVAGKQNVINADQIGSNVLNKVDEVEKSPMAGSTFNAETITVKYMVV